ncbi:hypothetical protein GV64_19100 [Endozoicomonas elysicola]|uniref:Uncharacterized protein n=1 Tax=Endozoicomonas elysicola TaxID=305900 RepID=A0A081KEH9_9GAMM|nr:hypothetical protein GV64_19100 [Endozoicomonas elysicola]
MSNELTQALSAAPLPNQDNSSVQVAGYGCLEPFDKCQQSFTLASLGELQPTIEMSKHATEMGQAQATRAIVTTASGQVHVSTRCSQVKKTETLKASYSFETLPRALKIPYPRDTGQPSKAEGTSRQANLPDLTSEPRRYSASTSGYLRLTGEDTRGRSCQSSEITGDNDDWTSAGAEASTTTSPIKRVQFGENEYRTFVNKSKKHRHHHESSGYDPSMENWLPGRTARYDQTSVDHKKARHRPEANRQVPEISDQYGQLSDEPNDFSTSEPSVRPKKQPAEEEKTPNPDTFSETEPKYPLQEPGSHVSMDTSPTLEGYDSSSEYPFHADLEIKEPDHEFITVAGKVLPTGASKTYQLTERPLEPSSAHYNPLPDTLKKYWADKANERQLSPVNQDWSGAKEEKEPKGVSIQIDRAAVQYMRRAEAHYQYKQGQQDISLHRQLVTQARSGTLTIVQNPSDPKSDYHEVRLRLRAANHRHDNAFREIRMLRNYEEKVDSKRISTNASDIEKEFPKSRVMQNKEDEIIRKAVEAEKPVDKKLLKKLSLEGQSDLIKKRCAKLETAFRHESGEIKELQNHQLSLLQTLASQSRKEGRKDRFEKQWAKLERQQARYEQEKEGLLAWAEQGRQQMLRQEAVRRIQKGYSVMRDSDLTKSEHNKMENNLKEKEGRVAQAEQGDSRPFDKKFYRKETPL